jgi:PAS domain S-box-containing protein
MQELGPFTIHWRPPQLKRGGEPIKLSNKQFKVLTLLIKARGRVVGKDLFFKKVWEDKVVEEANLSQTIFLLRRALGKLPDGSEFIETLPGEGYRISARALMSSAASAHAVLDSTRSFASAASREEIQIRMLVNSIEDYAVYMLDCTGRVLTWNRGAELLKGYTSLEVVGEHYSLFFIPEDIEGRVPYRELSVAELKGRCSGEGWRIRKNGERFWASFVLTAMRGPTGKLVGFSKVVRDLSERKRQEDALLRMEHILRQERDRFRAVADSSTDTIFICEAVRDPDGDIDDFVFTYLNRNGDKIFAFPHESLIGARMCEALSPSQRRGLFDACKRVVLSGRPLVTQVAMDEEDPARCTRLHVVRLEGGVAVTASDLGTADPQREGIS